MKVQDLFQETYIALSANKARSGLTILGIIIGIAAVIIVMSAGESIKSLVLGEFESFGTDFIQVEIKVPTAKKNSVANAGGLAQGIQITTLKNKDAEDIGKINNVKSYGGGLMGQDVISYLNANKIVNYLGSSANTLEIMGVEVDRGRAYSAEEDNQLAKVAVIGSKVAADLFGNDDPLGKNIKIPYTTGKSKA